MIFQDGEPGLRGQELVYNVWRRRLHGRRFIARDDLDLPAMIKELAHVAILACESGGSFRFRLAGTGLRAAFGCEARGKSVAEIEMCRGVAEWTQLAAKTLARLAPIAGRTRLEDGTIHFWLRLPMSSDGVMADQVLCHDRFLPAEAIVDPEEAARKADMALRLDAVELAAA